MLFSDFFERRKLTSPCRKRRKAKGDRQKSDHKRQNEGFSRPSWTCQQFTYGVVSEGVLRKVCGNSAENSKNAFYCVRKGCGNSAESLRKFRGNLKKICNDPFPNNPKNELLNMWCMCPSTSSAGQRQANFEGVTLETISSLISSQHLGTRRLPVGL